MSIGYLNLPGTAGSIASTVNHASLNITGRTWLAVDIAATDWTPAAVMSLIGKYVVLFNLKQYLLQLLTDGKLRAIFSPNGSTDRIFDSTVAPVVSNGSRLAVGVDIQPDNGSSQRQATFYTATTKTGPWSQLGDPVAQAGAESIFTTTQPLVIGAHFVLSYVNLFTGKMYGAEVRNGGNTGTVVANPEYTELGPGTTQHVDSAGRLWSNAGDASIVGKQIEIPGQIDPADPALVGAIA